jgi:hypothetical protein
MFSATLTAAQSSIAHAGEPLTSGERARAYNREFFHTGHFATLSGEQGTDLAQ